MKEARISVHEAGAVICCVLLAPVFRGMPGIEAAMAGGWMSPLLALPVILLAVQCLRSVFQRLPEGTGLPGLYALAFGKRWGMAAAAMTILWAAAEGAKVLGEWGRSVVTTVYPKTSVWVFLLGIMMVAWKGCTKGMKAVCRMARAYLIIIGIVLALMLLLGVREIKLCHIWPVWLGSWRGQLQAGIPVLAMEGPLLLLVCSTEALHTRQKERKPIQWTVVCMLVIAMMRVVVLGMFGWQSAARLETPLFSAAKEMQFTGIIERIESMVVAVWMLSEIVWIAAILYVGKELIEKGIYPIRRELLITGLAVLIVTMSGITGETQWGVGKGETLMDYSSIVVCYGIPLAASMVLVCRRRI